MLNQKTVGMHTLEIAPQTHAFGLTDALGALTCVFGARRLMLQSVQTLICRQEQSTSESNAFFSDGHMHFIPGRIQVVGVSLVEKFSTNLMWTPPDGLEGWLERN